MSRFARVVVESDLIQLDREFDFIIPDALQDKVKLGSRVQFPLGRLKKLQTGFVTQILQASSFAASELTGIIGDQPPTNQEVLDFTKKAALRQCVAHGEVLKLAVPDFMPRTLVPELSRGELPQVTFPKLPGAEKRAARSAILSSARHVSHEGLRFPDWCWLLVEAAHKKLQSGKSSILILPEQDQISQLRDLFIAVGLGSWLRSYGLGTKKSDRFIQHQQILASDEVIAIGTRTAIYAPVTKLGLIAIFDDGDESLREQGSPHTHARELAMIRASNSTELMFVANYRTAEVQRLVEIGFLKDSAITLPPPRLSFTQPGSRLDAAAFRVIRDALDTGPVLMLVPRKGSSASLFCAGCGSRVRCQSCRGPVWEPTTGNHQCRLCSRFAFGCGECGSSQVRLGRTGTARSVTEIGKAFPGTQISESTQEVKPGRIKSKNHIVIATPGSAPRTRDGYQAVLVLDPDVWLSIPSLRAEQNAIRDWMEAFELLSDTGRGLIVGIDQHLGQAIALGQHRQLASTSLTDLGQLKLPPATRIASLESEAQGLQELLTQLTELGATVLNSDMSDPAKALIRFSYNSGPEIAQAIRATALKTNTRLVAGSKRRGLKVVMDDPTAL
ncbi:hypothetical protein HRU87_03630 [Aquiluna borgnonia]|uniref:Primosomal protein N' 3' DNA-binding domain-containing protein n=1 Tax=Aquiluna borgnonia TaxID=2499157 RepID=A0A7D4PXA0_9MICO|nr:hypothetical protein [Aquiluna borgnonia]QKJ25284.1 hypothetical protein HRU87_03630 [Aquiluna borgnonia]